MKLKYPLATLAGVLTWALVFAITLYLLPRVSGAVPLLPVCLLFVLYGGCFMLLTQEPGWLGLQQPAGKLLLLLQLASAFALLLWLPAKHFEYLAILSIIWVSLLPSVMPVTRALLLAALVVVVWFTVLALRQSHSVWINALLYGTFHLFAVLMQSATQAAQQAKDELASKHQQLLATQQLLQAASRQSERSRIARNLHDVVGHHLTALTIQLQVASHLTAGEARAQVEKCHQLAKLLLSDVREAVSTMRQYADVSLHDAISQLTALLPEQLRVKLAIAPDIMLADLTQAQHLLCIVQEALSNSLKHAAATQIEIRAVLHNGQLVLTIQDNGKLAPHWRAGNGIKGMQERLAECGGSLAIASIQQAMQLTLTLPYQESADV